MRSVYPTVELAMDVDDAPVGAFCRGREVAGGGARRDDSAVGLGAGGCGGYIDTRQ
jgi:hypothetical protein